MNVDSGLRLQLGGYVLFGDDAVIGSPMSLLTDNLLEIIRTRYFYTWMRNMAKTNHHKPRNNST
jgi:hypothetical protein